MRRTRLAWIVGGTLALLLTAASVLVITTCKWPFLDGHPHAIGLVTVSFGNSTEADCDRIFGCSGRLVRGTRAAGVAYAVEYSGDEFAEVVYFGPDGKAVGLQGEGLIYHSPSCSRTRYKEFLLGLRRMGFNARCERPD